MDFRTFNFDDRLFRAISELDYRIPTPIQKEAIPPILKGRDLIGLAQTGTGKTAAFGLPILQRLLSGKLGYTRTLILAPTRELAEQLYDNIVEMGRYTHVRSTTVYGGVPYREQTKRLHDGYEVVIACPGRLLDHMSRRNIDLSGVDTLILDEADRMFDMGFLPDIRRIMRELPRKRQSLLFSATMPWDIRRLANDILVDPVTIEIGRQAPVQTVSHALYAVAPTHKTDLLLKILEDRTVESALIFSQTRDGVRFISRALETAGLTSAAIQGDMLQKKRQAALKSFREGRVKILVATDIAARGLDISGVSHVINYDMPATVDDYIHRIGRTGRAANTGDAFTFVTHEDLLKVTDIERILGAQLEYKRIPDFEHAPPPWDPGARVQSEGPSRRPRRPTRPGLGRRR
ncbi:MAG: DEAD/DEAH box helicase [bacterium]|nr:DEAD/DEAH box helicase [bacterium]